MYLVSTIQCVFLVQIDKAIFFHSTFPRFISETLQNKPVSLSSFSAWESWSKKGRTWERCLGATGPILGPLPSLPDWEINEVAARPGPMFNKRPRQLSLFSEFPFVHLWKPSNSAAMGAGQVHGDVYCQQYPTVTLTWMNMSSSYSIFHMALRQARGFSSCMIWPSMPITMCFLSILLIPNLSFCSKRSAAGVKWYFRCPIFLPLSKFGKYCCVYNTWLPAAKHYWCSLYLLSFRVFAKNWKQNSMKGLSTGKMWSNMMQQVF